MCGRLFVVYFINTIKFTNVYYFNLIIIFFSLFAFIYSCTSKYVGEFCQHPNPCHTGAGPRCQNGGICEVVTYRDGTPQFSCRCPLGYTASLCEIREDNVCNSSPCNNGGICVLKSLKEYTCQCAQGYSGKKIYLKICELYDLYVYFFINLGPHCDKQNLCASSPCRNGGKCTSNSGGSFKCTCPNGFKGPTCAEDVEECATNPCRHGGTCLNTHGSYQ